MLKPKKDKFTKNSQETNGQKVQKIQPYSEEKD